MITRITDFKCLSGVSSPLLPLVYSSFCYPQNECDGAFLQTDEKGNVNSLFSLSGNSVVLISIVDGDFDELRSFFSFFKVKYITSQMHIDCFCASFEKHPLMQVKGNPQCKADCGSLTSSSSLSEYKSVHTLVGDNENKFEDWFPVFSKKINNENGFATYFEADGKMVSTAVAPFICGDCAVIAGVATDVAFRRRGFASLCVSSLVNTLVSKEKNNIFLWCKESLIPFYEFAGFTLCGNIYIGECKI